ncbi:hypothetical protein MUDAN_DOGOELCO_00161 [Lactiplantibacillus mudanjiangensis]|uniref:hypothetical protein n=1 Tax=Lactiplantibacillus mudanjiangensis TaxID=1296538 RepID=UPI001013D7A6|nr:hypothetical protein [Lactiplantibacillus mudanjiangensis]VDG30660.1 hypothetical protein MUDAN_DOGOELCO_00161 [Lactiplantibacillus mudanjiangensis]
MLFLAIIGIIVFLLAIFSLFSARQSGGGWKFLAVITVISALVTIYATIKLPFWPYNQTKTEQTTKSSSATSNSAKLDSSDTVFNEDSQKKAAATTKLKEDSILKQLKTNYQSIGTFTLDRDTKTFTLKPTGKKYVKSLKIIKKYPSKNQKARTTVVSNYESLSKSIKKNLAKGYTVRVLEPGTTKTLLSLKDGQVLVNNLKK